MRGRGWNGTNGTEEGEIRAVRDNNNSRVRSMMLQRLKFKGVERNEGAAEHIESGAYGRTFAQVC